MFVLLVMLAVFVALAYTLPKDKEDTVSEGDNLMNPDEKKATIDGDHDDKDNGSNQKEGFRFTSVASSSQLCSKIGT